jgi:hypothetical protein
MALFYSWFIFQPRTVYQHTASAPNNSDCESLFLRGPANTFLEDRKSAGISNKQLLCFFETY